VVHLFVHLDADAFFASVEQAADPRLRGKAVAVGGERRGIVASASYEARRYGVHTPMPTSQARRLCPHLIVVPGDFEKYERFSRWMFSYAYDFTAEVEISSIDEGYLDLRGVRRHPREVAETLRTAIRDSLKISVSEGIAANKLVSQVASKLRKPASLIQVLPGQERGFLSPLSTRWLPGIGPKTFPRFEAAGLTRIGQVAQTPVGHLALLVGSLAPQLREFAHGIDHRPVVAQAAPARSYSHQETFDQDVTDPARVEIALRRMADDLCRELRAERRMARGITVKVRYNDFAEDQASETLDEPTDLETDLYGRVHSLLGKAWRRRVSLRMTGLRLAHIYDAWTARGLSFEWEGAGYARRRRLADAVDKLRESRHRYVIMRGHDLEARGSGFVVGGTEAPRHDSGPAGVASGRDPSRREGMSRREAAPTQHDYVALHVHSFYSFLDSTLSIRDLVQLAADRGMEAVALTDTGNLHGAVEFAQRAEEAGIRPILGAEVRLDGLPLLLYPRDRRGYAQLCRILTVGHSFTRETFLFETDALVAIGAAPAWRDLLDGPYYLGAASRRQCERMATGGGLPIVAVPPVHCASPADRARHDILQSIRTRTLLDHGHPEKKRGRRHILLSSEMAAEFRDCPRALALTQEIAEQCRFRFDFGLLQFPSFSSADGQSASDRLRAEVLEGLRRRYGKRSAEVRPQVEEELRIIHEVGYEEYFLAVWDLLQECRRLNIPWLTRGSAADSLVCYCLGISSVCPIRFRLYFRRFLNLERMKMSKLPDIDIDFPHDRKDDVVDVMFRKYGRDRTAVVGGFSTYQSRSAFADVAKVLGVSEHQVRRLTEHIPHSRARDLDWVVRECIECRELPVKEEPFATALRVAQSLDGFPRHAKMHPCGVVISRQPMTELTPCFESAKGYPTTHFDMDSVEAIGLVKIDILAQGGLAVLRDTYRMLREESNVERTGSQVGPLPATGDRRPATAPAWSDPRVWDLISSGQARAVHHIESPAMTSLCRRCNVRDIDTLVAIVSVIRPGAANEQKKRQFTRRYQGLEPPVFVHPSVEDCLAETYGLIVYEEQVLQVCEAFADLDPGTADRLRRSLVKQNLEAVQALYPSFVQAARSRGRSAGEIETVWKFICGFNGYAFCKAHSAAYAVEAYESARLKLNHPAEFMAAVLSNGKGFYRPIVYALECHRLGMSFLPPSVQRPGPSFGVEGERIRAPVTRTSGLSARTVERLLARRADGPFLSAADFQRRVQPTPAEVQLLLQVGALDDLGPRRTALFWQFEHLRLRDGGGSSLFTSDGGPDYAPAVHLSEPARLDRLRAEMELLDFPVSGHPLDLYPDVAWETYCPVRDLPAHAGEQVTCCGLVVEDRITQQMTGEPMKFMTLADYTGMVETELFAATYRRHGLTTIRYPVLEVTGTVESFDNQRGFTLRVRSAHPPRCAASRGPRRKQRATPPCPS